MRNGIQDSSYVIANDYLLETFFKEHSLLADFATTRFEQKIDNKTVLKRFATMASGVVLQNQEDGWGKYTASKVNITNETLEIGKPFGAAFMINSIIAREFKEHGLPTEYHAKIRERIRDNIEAQCFDALKTASLQPVEKNISDFSAANIGKTFTEFETRLDNDNYGSMEGMKIISSTASLQNLTELALNNASTLSAEAFKKGYKGTFQGIDTCASYKLPADSTLTFASVPANDATITIGGVQFTFKTSADVVANSYHIDRGTTVATAATNFENFLKTLKSDPASLVPTGDDDGMSVLDARNLEKIRRFATEMTVEATAGVVKITALGVTKLVFTLPTGMTESDNYTYAIVYTGKPLDVVMPIQVEERTEPIEGRFVHQYLYQMYYGKKVFADGLSKFFVVKIKN